MQNRTKPPRKAARMILFGLLGLLALCAGLLVLSAAINASLPQASAEPDLLSAEQAALMEEALHLKAELGDRVWPGFGRAEIPILAWNEKNAFLCAHPQTPAGWQALEEIQVAGKPCYRMAWEDGQNFAERIGDRWTGALATREWGLVSLRRPFSEMLPQPVSAVAPVFLLVGELMRPHRYIGGELHESFHAFQAVEFRQHFEDAELAYPAGDRYWEQDPQMNAAWQAEIEALYEAVYAESDSTVRSLARQFLELRQTRRQHFLTDPDLILYEQRFEWLEGLAKYVELHTLRAAGETPGYQSVPALFEETSFRNYAAVRQLYDQEMSQMKRQATATGDARFYYTGNAQAVLLDRWMPDWKSRVGEPGVWLEDLLSAALAP